MKRTFQLFQLLIVVFGFYAAIKYSGNAKYIISLSSIAVVGILDKMESFLDSINRDVFPREKAAPEKSDPLAKALHLLLRSKNNLMLVDAAQALLRDLGLIVVPCLEFPMLDRIVKVDDQVMQIAIKVVADIDGLLREWEHLDHADGFINSEGVRLRLLLIVSAGAEQSQTMNIEAEKLPVHVGKFLADRHTVAITTQTLAQIYQLCKDTHQDPKRVFGRIYHHPGGIFQL